MNWIDILKNFGIFSVGTISITGLIGYLGKKLIETYLTQRVEKYKADLESESKLQKVELDQKLENYKAELTRINFEHQIRFSKLHVDRAEAIKELFRRLVRLQDSMESLMRRIQFVGERPIIEKLAESGRLGNEFLDFFKENELIFNEGTGKLIYAINDQFLSAWRDFNLAEQFKDVHDPDLIQDVYKKRLKAYDETLMTEVPKIKGELITEFRKILQG